MRLLLDTHALLWWLANDERIGPRARDLIGQPDNDVIVSVVSLWEVVIKVRVGKLKADINELLAGIKQTDFLLIGISAAHLRVLATLPSHHRDPFDHLLMAQAAAEGAVFLSDDRNVAMYPIEALTCAGLAVSRA